MITHRYCETKEHMEPKATLGNESGNDMVLPGTLRKTLKARFRGRRRRQIILSDEEEEHDHQKDTTPTIFTPEVDLEKYTRPSTQPSTPAKKRTTTEAYPSPPSTMKKIRLSLSPDGDNKLEVVTAEYRPSEMKRDNRPRPIVLSKRNNVDNVEPVHHETLTPQELWEEKQFDLSSPRLVRPLPLRYKLVEEQSPSRGGPNHRVFVPEMPADDIKKTLCVHPKHTNIRWAGEQAERTLAGEIAMYERVKNFWLFNFGYAYCPGWDRKHEFVAVEFAEEMQRPRVVAWLAELIGRKDVYTVLDHLERRMTKELERMGAEHEGPES